MPTFNDRLKEAIKKPRDEALGCLTRLANDAESIDQMRKLGGAIQRLTFALPQVHLLGQCTLDFLAPILAAELLRRDLPAKVVTGPYGQPLQTLTALSEGFVVLVPWSERPLDLEQELLLWRACWQQAQQAKLKLLQVGYDWVGFDAHGHSRNPALQVEKLNAALRREMPTGSFFLDLPAVSGLVGRRNFYDRRNYFWTKQPFGELGIEELARHLAAGLQALARGPKKVLVLDLDNTLWGGEVGEIGWPNLALSGPEGEAYLDFQRLIKEYQQRGVVLAIASKNDEHVAREAFKKHPELRLRWDDFAAHQIHWLPKSQSLLLLAEELNLGLDSFVFFDDNPRERAEVSSTLPQVTVIEVSPDPSDFADDLRDSLCFETLEITEDDLRRGESYRADKVRRQSAQGTVEEYLEGLEMRARIEPIGAGTLQRALQLLSKTNQFNLTTRRHGAADLMGFLDTPGAYVRGLFLEDRFGDLGFISILIALPGDGRLEIDTWLMSCRALQRTVEFHFLADLISFAQENDIPLISGVYIPTAKNSLVSDLFPRCGFRPAPDGQWWLETSGATVPRTFVSPWLADG
jgi:FkbH-like protein